MRKIGLLAGISIAALEVLSACTTTSSYIPLHPKSPRGKNCELDIVMPGESPKKTTQVIGSFSVQEMGLSVNCAWPETLQKNKDHACEAGAQGIQFLTVDAPFIHSTCYRTKANFFIYE
ncbi:MAG TPA: hypothetical protein VE954_10135 [Oligoflexus sp.]|uniref:hypothetical protein n=1 Tax=Oligoflexus sp. TaxID=1971216 RepID=UPI002D4940A0|nr:hypothetical protein [Oligoflexus sp.]HYX33461.1 hypothetical protein [Oligoflexus sp.]